MQTFLEPLVLSGLVGLDLSFTREGLLLLMSSQSWWLCCKVWFAWLQDYIPPTPSVTQIWTYLCRLCISRIWLEQRPYCAWCDTPFSIAERPREMQQISNTPWSSTEIARCCASVSWSNNPSWEALRQVSQKLVKGRCLGWHADKVLNACVLHMSFQYIAIGCQQACHVYWLLK